MANQRIRNMKYGDLVESLRTEEVFRLVENIDDKMKTVTVINSEDDDSYFLLNDLINDQYRIIDKLRKKMQKYERELRISDIK